MAAQLIVLNADDLGISEAVNDAIFAFHDLGLVTNATLLVNGPAVEHALVGASDRPDLGVGVHLNTSEFDPLTPAFERFRARNADLDLRTHRRPAPSMVQAVAAEWLEQLARADALGVDATHVDSHHFDHVNPALFPALVAVRRRTTVRRARSAQNLWSAERSRAVRVAKSLHARGLTSVGLRTTDFMTDATSFLELLGRGRVPEDASIEVMLHPGHEGYRVENDRMVEAAEQIRALPRASWRAI